jgi:hypothetical protein
VNNEGVIQARTLVDKNGKILLLAYGGTVQASGVLDASAPDKGSGGFIETSADRVHLAPELKVTTAASHGKSGEWLIDPTDFTIAASGGDITGALLSSSLNAGNDSKHFRCIGYGW